MKPCVLLLCLLATFVLVEACIEDELAALNKLVRKLARQIMMQGVINQEQVRADGNSGTVTQRRRLSGSRPYHSDSFSGMSVNSMHDHADHQRTVGSGEQSVVLNGVAFSTRHNDYMLNKASSKSSDYHATEPVQFPEVPPEVLAMATVEEQIAEMKEWFKAWRDMNHKDRDYKKYFKPVLCYLEGAWVNTDGTGSEAVEESFDSDRHFLKALDYNDLNNKNRFMLRSGSKNNAENYAFLPTTIYDMDENGEPVFAQWHYRILCHPLKRYLKPNRLRVLDDVAFRAAFNRSLETHEKSRSARFHLNFNDSNIDYQSHFDYELLDDLMGEIPGKNNYKGVLSEDAFNLRSMEFNDPSTEHNAAYYFRRYKVEKKGANGAQDRLRGFNDDNLFMALTTHPQVAALRVHDKCKINNNGQRVCPDTFEQRWSYAIPLEIIYLTPLWNWNPFNIEHNDTGVQCENCTGGFELGSAYRGTTSRTYYRTPEAFFSSKVTYRDDGDTSGKTVGVLNKDGVVCPVKASGTYINLPEIEGVGVMRQRYPIVPIQQAGSACWKELSALKDIVLNKGGSFTKMKDDYDMV